MTRTERITRLCEISAGLADLQGQAQQLGIELHEVILDMQDGGEMNEFTDITSGFKDSNK